MKNASALIAIGLLAVGLWYYSAQAPKPRAALLSERKALNDRLAALKLGGFDATEQNERWTISERIAQINRELLTAA